jgi:hypothetical protein
MARPPVGYTSHVPRGREIRLVQIKSPQGLKLKPSACVCTYIRRPLHLRPLNVRSLQMGLLRVVVVAHLFPHAPSYVCAATTLEETSKQIYFKLTVNRVNVLKAYSKLKPYTGVFFFIFAPLDPVMFQNLH